MRRGMIIIAITSVVMAVSNSLAGHSIQRLAGRDPLGIAFWRFDLGNFLWQYPDQQIITQITSQRSEP